LIRVGAKMLMILFIAFLAGIIRCRYWTSWKWALIMLAWAIVAPVLFAVGGTLENPAGDGIISHQFRTATNDGPGMEFFGLAYLLVFFGGFAYFTSRAILAVKRHQASHLQPQLNCPSGNAAEPEGLRVSSWRKSLEVAALCLATVAVIYVQHSDN
jgi:hypothetical protein